MRPDPRMKAASEAEWHTLSAYHRAFFSKTASRREQRRMKQALRGEKAIEEVRVSEQQLSLARTQPRGGVRQKTFRLTPEPSISSARGSRPSGEAHLLTVVCAQSMRVAGFAVESRDVYADRGVFRCVTAPASNKSVFYRQARGPIGG